MNIFMQGMRRSGTTIAFDIFFRDPAFDCYYEPLADATRSALGGGSGVSSVDFFDKIRAVRAAFLCQSRNIADGRHLNYGAPRDALLEFAPSLPDYCHEYVRFMLEQAPDTVLKFTRAYCKVADLKAIDPHAWFVHIVRDPRAVATSYLYGKGQKNREKFEKKHRFFTRRTEKSAWSSYPLSEHIRQLPQYAHLLDLNDYERVLLIWHFCFHQTHTAGLTHFGPRYYLLSHEALISRPEAAVTALYSFLKRPVPEAVMPWARTHVLDRSVVHEPESIHWQEAITRLHLGPALRLLDEATAQL